jgi:hypothetical protein
LLSAQNTAGKTSRVQVGELPQQEKELENVEAEQVKGGGGRIGGVICRIGEEVPAQNRN